MGNTNSVDIQPNEKVEYEKDTQTTESALQQAIAGMYLPCVCVYNIINVSCVHIHIAVHAYTSQYTHTHTQNTHTHT